MTMKDYRTIVVGTDGSSLAEPTVGRAAWLANHDDANLVIVCAYAKMSRRDEAKNVTTLGGDSRVGQVLGREAAGLALSEAMAVAGKEGAVVTAALLIDGEPGQPVRVAPALPRQGQAIAAIGSPKGLDFSMSAGIVSRHGQVGGLIGAAGMLQIDAPIAGGNSGGVVVNGRGEAVGLVSHSAGPFTQAVPIGRALAVAAQLEPVVP